MKNGILRPFHNSLSSLERAALTVAQRHKMDDENGSRKIRGAIQYIRIRNS
jgi:hypothetical protein